LHIVVVKYITTTRMRKYLQKIKIDIDSLKIVGLNILTI
jgi:hypothetical protein